MKKVFFFLLITFLLLTGCEKKNETIEIEESKYGIAKLDSQRDYVYFETLQSINCKACTDYDLQYAYINLNSDSVANINLEIKNFVNTSYQAMVFEEEFVQGRLFHYDYFINEKYITLIQDYSYFIESIPRDINSRIYVVNKETGRLISNADLLKEKEMTEEDLFSFILNLADLEDSLFVLSILKQDGYQLYFNQKMDLILRYYERDNDDVIKRELLVR